MRRGKSGYHVWRFKLVKATFQGQLILKESTISLIDTPARQTERKQTSILRIIRDTKKSREIKELYQYHCQVCNLRIEGPAGPYAEAAHIHPLGQPHNGPDAFENLLCLCPNHHAMFDLGMFTINHDLSLDGISGQLTLMPQHQISPDHLIYHRNHYS